MILILAALSLAGVFLPQIPANMAASPKGYAWWVENVASQELGGAANILAPLGFFHMFRSVWFIAAAGLLMLNILVCTAVRIRPLRLKTQIAAVQRDDAFYGDGDAVSFGGRLNTLSEKTETALHTCRYSVRRAEDAEAIWLAADKRRLSPWGTLAVHLSLILLLAGVLLNGLLGFHYDAFTIAEGETMDVGYGTNLSVRLDAFADTYWEDGMPMDYQSDVTVYHNGEIVKSGIIRVNHPLSVNGVRFHQGYFGPAAGLAVTGENGESLYSGSVALTGSQTGGSLTRPKGLAVLPDSRFSVILLGSAGSLDTSIGDDQIGVELYDGELNFIGWLLLTEDVPAQLDGMTFTYQPLQYSGFTVSRESGAPLLWSAAALFLLGLAMLFYFPHQTLWIRLRQVSDSEVSVTVKPAGGSDTSRIWKALGTAKKPGGNHRES